MYYETVTPKFISITIFWSFFLLIMCFSMVTQLADKCRWCFRYARICARAYSGR